MKNILIIPLLLLFISACNNSTPTFEKLSKDSIILAFGDSLTYGTGSTNDSSYPSLLSKYSFHKVINAGISGEVTGDGLIRLPALLDKHRPELLILIHGGNDIVKKIPQQQIIENLNQMIVEAKQRDIKVVMMGVPTFGLLSLESAELYAQVAEKHHVPIDLTTLPKILSSNSLKSDMIHPNNTGYKIMAENIFSLLINTGAL